jgi:hypothetical protein
MSLIRSIIHHITTYFNIIFNIRLQKIGKSCANMQFCFESFDQIIFPLDSVNNRFCLQSLLFATMLCKGRENPEKSFEIQYMKIEMHDLKFSIPINK